MPATQADHDLAAARGFAVTGLIDKLADTRLKPGKPYDLPAGAERVALLAEPLPAPPVAEITHDLTPPAPVKQRRAWTKAEQQRETQAIRDGVDLRAHAERLGYVQVSGVGAKLRLENKTLDKADPMREITLRINARGEESWIAVKGGSGSGLGGDVFHLHQHATGASFLETRDELRKIASGRDFESGIKHQGTSTAERAALAEQRREREALHAEFRRAAAYKQYKQTSDHPNAFLASRGIDEQTLAETKWRTDRHGNAVFPHIREDGKFTGFERKQDGPALFSKSERGVYIANPGCEVPERIKVAEGGLDALSLYQLDTPEQRARTLYVSSGGNPADDTARALRGLADRTGARQVDLVYDRDEAGTRHTEALKQLLAEQTPGLQVSDRRGDYRMTEGEDPNDLLRRKQSQPQQAVPDQQAESPQPPVAPKPATLEEVAQETPAQRRSM